MENYDEKYCFLFTLKPLAPHFLWDKEKPEILHNLNLTAVTIHPDTQFLSTQFTAGAGNPG
jgi:hypothetical protein